MPHIKAWKLCGQRKQAEFSAAFVDKKKINAEKCNRSALDINEGQPVTVNKAGVLYLLQAEMVVECSVEESSKPEVLVL